VSELVNGAVPIFDGHNDTVLSLRNTGRSFFERSETGHIDLPRARAGGLAGGFFAVWVPDPGHAPQPGEQPDPDVSVYTDAEKMPSPMGVEYAQNYALGSLALLIRQADAADGEVEIVTTAADLRRCIEDECFAIELHLEGAEAIEPGLDALEVYARAGVRSVGLAWSRPNAFASGVPFQFGHSPDTGPGLTDAGRELVRACNRLGIVVDVSHLNEAGFWDVAAVSEDPIVATHSCAFALCPSTRNLTDKQLDAVRESDGIVGVNFHVGFLRSDGKELPAETTVAAIADHVDYLAKRMGIDHVAFGSDFDGATMPGDLRDAAGLPLLIAELRRRGYDETSLRKLGYENWLRVFERTW
jgi:membrane dipeptidase